MDIISLRKLKEKIIQQIGKWAQEKVSYFEKLDCCRKEIFKNIKLKSSTTILAETHCKNLYVKLQFFK